LCWLTPSYKLENFVGAKFFCLQLVATSTLALVKSHFSTKLSLLSIVTYTISVPPKITKVKHEFTVNVTI